MGVGGFISVVILGPRRDVCRLANKLDEVVGDYSRVLEESVHVLVEGTDPLDLY